MQRAAERNARHLRTRKSVTMMIFRTVAQKMASVRIGRTGAPAVRPAGSRTRRAAGLAPLQSAAERRALNRRPRPSHVTYVRNAHLNACSTGRSGAIAAKPVGQGSRPESKFLSRQRLHGIRTARGRSARGQRAKETARMRSAAFLARWKSGVSGASVPQTCAPTKCPRRRFSRTERERLNGQPSIVRSPQFRPSVGRKLT